MTISLRALAFLAALFPSSSLQHTQNKADSVKDLNASPKKAFREWPNYENYKKIYDLMDPNNHLEKGFCVLARPDTNPSPFNQECVKKFAGNKNPGNPYPELDKALEEIYSDNGTAQPGSAKQQNDGEQYRDWECGTTHTLYSAISDAWKSHENCRAQCETCMMAAYARHADAAICYSDNDNRFGHCEMGFTHVNPTRVGEVEQEHDTWELDAGKVAESGSRWRILSNKDGSSPAGKMGSTKNPSGPLWVEYVKGYYGFHDWQVPPPPDNDNNAKEMLERLLGPWKDK